MTSVWVQFVLIFAQPMQCSSVCCLRLPNDHRQQPVTEPKPMSLPLNHREAEKLRTYCPNIYTVPGFCSTSLDSKSNKKTVAPLFARKLFIILSAIWHHHHQSITLKLPFCHTFCLKKTPFGQYSTCRQRLKTEQFGL